MEDSAYPIPVATKQADEATFVNHVVGGLTRLEYAAIHIYAGLISSGKPVDYSDGRRSSIDAAQKLLHNLESAQ